MEPMCAVNGVRNSQMVTQALIAKSVTAARALFHMSLGIG